MLPARFTVTVDSDRSAGRRAHLHTMLQAAEIVGDIPVFRPTLALDSGATLDVLRVHLSAATTRVGADRGSSDSATGRGDVPAASASDLVTQNAANHAADDRPRNVGAVASIFNDLLALDPATLLRGADHRTHGSHWHVVQPFVGTPAILVGGRGKRFRRLVLVTHIPADRAHRRNAVVHTHPCQRVVTAWAQHHAATFESRVLAHLPAPAIDNGR